MHTSIGIKKATRLAVYSGAAVKDLISLDFAAMVNRTMEVLSDHEIVDKRFNSVHVKFLASLDIGMAVLLRDVLASLGRLVGDERIDWLGFRFDPTLKFSEQVDVVMNAALPDPLSDDVTNKFPMTRLELATHVATYCGEVRRVMNRRSIIESELDNAANHLLFIVERQGGFDMLSQKERSYLLLRYDYFYSEGRALPRPNMNSESMTLITPLFEHVLDAPKRDLVTILTTQDRHNLCMSYTPYRNQLRTSQGYLERVGNLEELDMREATTMPWDTDEHLSAVCEGDDRVIFLPKRDGDSACLTYSFFTGPLMVQDEEEWDDMRCRIVLDDPEIMYRYNSETQGLEMVFDSVYRGGRKTITTDPMEFYLDMALRPSSIHETPVMYESFDEFNMVKIGDTKQFFFELGTEDNISAANSIPVHYYKDEAASREGKLSTKLVNAIPWLDYGSTFTRPVLGVYCLKLRDFIFNTDESAVDFLLNFIDLSKRMQHKNRLPILMSYNAFIVNRVLGKKFPDLKKFISEVTKGGVV
jgi:hypothetical protein